MDKISKKHAHGFTIVELLVVIVVIGILAAITIVSYLGINQKAMAASLVSDLDNASKQLKLFQVENGNYPTTISCIIPDSTTNKCIKASTDNTYTYRINNISNHQVFCLTATNASQSYNRNQDGSSSCSIMYLDAGNTLSYPGSGTTWSDLSGFNNNGTLNNGVSYDTISDGEMIFDGTDDWISVLESSSLDLTSGVTIEAWLNPATPGVLWYGVLSKGNAQSYALTLNSSQRYLHFETPASNAINSPIPAFLFDNWIYAVVTFDGSTKRIYINGSLVANGPMSSLILNNEALRIGQGNNGEYFKGKIGYIGLYNGALSESEIFQNFNTMRERYGI